MNRKNLLPGLVLLGSLVFTVAAQAAQPGVDIGDRHGNLRAAQEQIDAAFQSISRAQEANDSRLGGHAGRAKELLTQASEELRMAADTANDNQRRW